ncbi:adenylate kinase family protein [Rhabdochlamydiaceae symbiont of Dictyostelium giganteum]|uniref:adenylate kinase family protein n=1 Tax=Rhabdochlamydiaceae symbiont of Dictyostelium giganteum TaxID=3342349 RepID=UPI00384C6568
MLVPNASSRYKAILIFGPPGSGKGTLGKALKEDDLYFHLSSGDIFRSLSSDSPAGQLYHSFAGQGLLLPDDATLKIWHAYVEELILSQQYDPTRQILLLDGIPRTSIQAEMISNLIEVLHVIVLTIPSPDLLITRMKKRATLEGRVDDMDESILKTRLGIYEKTTKQLLERYSPHLVTSINGDQTPESVLQDVKNTLLNIKAS